MPIASAADHLLAARRDEYLALRKATRAMGEMRRAEFVAGRVCAGWALQAAGVRDTGPVLAVDRGLPVWPAGWLGSISHSGGWAIAGVARTAQCGALGLDFQGLMGESTVADVRPLVATERELARLEPNFGAGHALTLLFSAKEALYKALYPRLRTFQDFDAAELTAVSEVRAELTLTLTRNWDDGNWPAGRAICVCYRWIGDFVLTACCLEADAVSDIRCAPLKPSD